MKDFVWATLLLRGPVGPLWELGRHLGVCVSSSRRSRIVDLSKLFTAFCPRLCMSCGMLQWRNKIDVLKREEVDIHANICQIVSFLYSKALMAFFWSKIKSKVLKNAVKSQSMLPLTLAQSLFLSSFHCLPCSSHSGQLCSFLSRSSKRPPLSLCTCYYYRKKPAKRNSRESIVGRGKT